MLVRAERDGLGAVPEISPGGREGLIRGPRRRDPAQGDCGNHGADVVGGQYEGWGAVLAR
jgi:hypothetical protein